MEYLNGKKKSRSNLNLDDVYNHLLKYGNSLFNSSLCLKTIIQEIDIDENKSKAGWEDFDLILRSLKFQKIFSNDKILEIVIMTEILAQASK